MDADAGQPRARPRLRRPLETPDNETPRLVNLSNRAKNEHSEPSPVGLQSQFAGFLETEHCRV